MRVKPFCVVLTVLFLSFASWIISNPLIPEYKSNSVLSWKELIGFNPNSDACKLPQLHCDANIKAIKWVAESLSSNQIKAVSEPFLMNERMFELQAAGLLSIEDETSVSIYIAADRAKTQQKYTVGVLNSSSWFPIRFIVPEHFLGKQVFLELELIGNSKKGNWLAIYPLISFLQPKTILFQGIPPLDRISIILALIFFLPMLFLLYPYMISLRQPLIQFLLLFFSIACFHFNTWVYYFNDEWDVVDKFYKNGWKVVFDRHNDHLMPLYLSLFNLETKLFGLSYLWQIAFSLFLHCIISFLLIRLISSLAAFHPKAYQASIFLGIVYTLNSLHTENLQWAFEQQILTCELFMLIVAHLVIHYVRNKSSYILFFIGLCSFLTPFCFGNGFALVLQILVFFVSCIWLYIGDSTAKQKFNRVITAVLVCCFAIILTAVFYILEPSQTSSLSSVNLLYGHISEIASYVWVGCQLGSFLRGLGLVSSLNANAPAEMLSGTSWMKLDIYMVCANIGFILNLILIVIPMCLGKFKKQFLSLWIFGQLFMIASFILPAIGRYQQGTFQALSLRYHSISLVGVCIALLPFVLQMFTWADSENRAPLKRCLVNLFLVLLLCAHFILSKEFDYFLAKGFNHRLYFNQLIDYHSSGMKTATNLPPAYPETLSHWQNGESIYLLYKYLSNQKNLSP